MRTGICTICVGASMALTLQTATAYSYAQSKGGIPEYQVVLRVVRPQWRIQPSETMVNQMDYRAITGSTLTFADAASDKEFLDAVQKANPKFRFTGVISKTTIILPVDKEWSLPTKVSPQQLNLAIVKNNIDLLRERPITAPHPALSVQGSKTIKPQNNTHDSLLLAIKGNYTKNVIDRTYNHGYILLSYYLRCFAKQKENKSIPYITADMVLSMPLRSTKCLETNLPIVENGSAPKLLPTDVLFVTVTPKK